MAAILGRVGAILPQLGVFTEHSVVDDRYRRPPGSFCPSPSPYSGLGSGLRQFRGPEGPPLIPHPGGASSALGRLKSVCKYISLHKNISLIIVKYKLLYKLNTIYIANKNTLNSTNDFSLFRAAASRPESCRKYNKQYVLILS